MSSAVSTIREEWSDIADAEPGVVSKAQRRTRRGMADDGGGTWRLHKWVSRQPPLQRP